MIKTNRLILREFTLDDGAALYRVLGDQENMKFYPYTFDLDRVNFWIKRNLERYQTLGFGLWAVCLKSTGELIGDCGLSMQVIDGVIRPEIGYHIRRDLHGQGYAKEASTAVRDWAFTHTPFTKLYSYMHADNKASRQTALSWGARFLYDYDDENHEPVSVYEMAKESWSLSILE